MATIGSWVRALLFTAQRQHGFEHDCVVSCCHHSSDQSYEAAAAAEQQQSAERMVGQSFLYDNSFSHFYCIIHCATATAAASSATHSDSWVLLVCAVALRRKPLFLTNRYRSCESLQHGKNLSETWKNDKDSTT
jgi:hypothetical protein